VTNKPLALPCPDIFIPALLHEKSAARTQPKNQNEIVNNQHQCDDHNPSFRIDIPRKEKK